MKVLCQDCLAVRSYTDRRHLGIDRCNARGNCGGEFCGCYACQETARDLKNGIRDGKALGLSIERVYSWSAKRGIK